MWKRGHLLSLFAAYASLIAAFAAVWDAKLVASFAEGQSNILMMAAVLAAAAGAFTSLVLLRRAREARSARQVFIIYAREDLEAAQQISGWLREANFSPWLDDEQLLPGQRWKEETERALTESGAALVIISTNLEQSSSAGKELDLALKRLQTGSDRTTPIIPVRIDQSRPPSSLDQIQWVDFSSENAHDRLILGLELATSQRGRPLATS